jgi:phosphoglycerol transferase MdoB-like AlkP superfamily enzyme
MTLPTILDKHGYQSYFFSPHKSERPFTLMLNPLGFDRVFTYESIGKQLLKGQFLARQGTAALDDQSLFRGVIAFLEQRHASGNDKPFFIGTYNIGTHAFVGTDANDLKYRDGASPVLNKLHNYDSALGQFLRYFYRSPYADNTILVFTSDHATYPETAYRKVAGKNLRPFFVDRIPLLIDDPLHTLPRVYDAGGRNSLDLAPTILQLLDIRNAENSFLGRSLFEPRDFVIGMAGLGNKLFLTTKKHGVFSAETVPHQLRGIFQCEADVVRRYYKAERENRLVKP